MLRIRKAKTGELGCIMAIYAGAQEYMIANGNPTQWARSNPKSATVLEDIETGRCLVICEGDSIHGVFALLEGPDPTYGRIEDGAWLNEEPYVAIHRIAGDGKAHGIFRCASDYCKGLSDNVRVDTHRRNLTMLRQLEGNGFIRCGIIHVTDGTERIAYQWCRGFG